MLVKEYNNIKIYQKKEPINLLHKYMSWSTNYVNKSDVLTSKKIDITKNIINLGLDFKNAKYNLEINVNDENKYNLNVQNDEIYEIIYKTDVQCGTDDIELFLNTLMKKLDIGNEQFEQNPPEPESDPEEETYEYCYESEDDNAFEFFENNDDLEKISKVNVWKRKAREIYITQGFNPQKVNESLKFKFDSEYVIRIILKEIEELGTSSAYYTITPIRDNIFDIDVIYTNFSNEKINDQILQGQIPGICMNIKLNKDLYPFFPPQISFKYPKMAQDLDTAIMNISYFNIDTWNPTNTLSMLVKGVYKILNKYCQIEYDEDDETFCDIKSSLNLLMKNNNLKLINCPHVFDIDHVEITNVAINNKETKQFWPTGVGYSNANVKSSWNINKYIEIKNLKIKMNINNLEELKRHIKNNIREPNLYLYLSKTNFLNIINFFTKQINLVEIQNNHQLYRIILDIVRMFDLDKLSENSHHQMNNIAVSLQNIKKDLAVYIKLQKDGGHVNIIREIIQLSNNFEKYILEQEVENSEHNHQIEYCKLMKNMQFGELGNNYKYHYSNKTNLKPSKECKSTLVRELGTYSTSLPLHYDTTILLRYDQDNIQRLKLLIIGPKDTPYENGCFEFDIFIPDNYPNTPPLVNLETTGGGTVRFNPNLYDSGKVCLSLLGTWRGGENEKWNSKTSTLFQVFISIQSLILVENPYFNEPSYESQIGTERGKKNDFDYNDNIRFQTMVWAMNDMLKNPPEDFREAIYLHFKLKKDDIMKRLEVWEKESIQHRTKFRNAKEELIRRLKVL